MGHADEWHRRTDAPTHLRPARSVRRCAAAVLLLAGCSRATQQAATGGEHAGHDMAPAPAAAAAGAHAGHDMAPASGAGAAARAMPRHQRQLLISAESLRTRLDSGVVIIHVGRTDSAYLAGHLPGARFLPLSAFATTVNGVANELPPLEQVAGRLSSLVIRDTDRIVLYGDDLGLLAARAWLALDVMGHGDRAALLDGGLAAWRAAGGRVDTGPIALQTIHIPFVVRPRPERVVDAAWVRAHLNDSTVVFVDARPAEQFGGFEAPCPPAQPACPQIPEARRGHIPGARNMFWQTALLAPPADTRLKSMHQLHHEAWQHTGADAARTVVVYCRTGFMSSHAYWQARYVGYSDVRIYDGSFIEWSGLDAARHPVAR